MPTTTTEVSRLQLDHPDFDHDGGVPLHGKVRTAWTKIGDNMDSRFFTADALGDTASVDFIHNFKLSFDDIEFKVYERNTGSGELTRITVGGSPDLDDFTIVATPGSLTTSVRVTNNTGGPVDIAVIAVQGLSVAGSGVPLGTIIALDDRWANTTAPPTGTISSDGYQLCDGVAVAAGNGLGAGPSLPDLTDGRFLRGSTVSGTTGGANSVTLTEAQIPSHRHSGPSHSHTMAHTHTGPEHSHTMAHTHTGPEHSHTMAHTHTGPEHSHGAGSYSTSLSGTFASSSHTHGDGSLKADMLLAGAPAHWRWNQSTSTSWTSNRVSTLNEGVGTENIAYTNAVVVSGTTGTPSATASLGGSNSVTGSSGLDGDGTTSGSSAANTGLDGTGTTSGSSAANTGLDGDGTTSGSSAANTGFDGTDDTGPTGGGSSFGITPTYLNVKYLMRVK